MLSVKAFHIVTITIIVLWLQTHVALGQYDPNYETRTDIEKWGIELGGRFTSINTPEHYKGLTRPSIGVFNNLRINHALGIRLGLAYASYAVGEKRGLISYLLRVHTGQGSVTCYYKFVPLHKTRIIISGGSYVAGVINANDVSEYTSPQPNLPTPSSGEIHKNITNLFRPFHLGYVVNGELDLPVKSRWVGVKIEYNQSATPVSYFNASWGRTSGTSINLIYYF